MYKNFDDWENEKKLNIKKGYLIAFIVSTILWFGVFIIFTKLSHSNELKTKKTKYVCDKNPETLSPELKKAYYELKKAGIDIKIECFDRLGQRFKE